MRSMIVRGLVGLSLLVPAVARATPITISGDTGVGLEGLGSFTGSLDYNGASSIFSVTLTNTSAASAGGYITGFAFNVAGSSTATLSGGGSFVGISGVSAQPFGTFEDGAALGGNWLGGGSPVGGIGVGQSKTFAFLIGGADASLTTGSFLSTASPSGDFTFAVRFRGFLGGGSDKLGLTTLPPVGAPPEDAPIVPEPPLDGPPVDGIPTGEPPVQTPLPAAVWAGFAMAGMIGGWRKARRRA